MLYKGRSFRHAPHLRWRNARPGDKDSRGRELVDRPGSYVVITTRKKHPEQHVELAYSRTNMGCGPWRRRKEYWTRTEYLVLDNCVYTYSHAHYVDPEASSAVKSS
jgi:hypothetical protein